MAKIDTSRFDQRFLASMVDRMRDVRTYTQYMDFLRESGYYDQSTRTVVQNYPTVRYREKSGLEKSEDCLGNEARCTSRANELSEEGKTAWVEWVPRGYEYAEAVWNSRDESQEQRQSDVTVFSPVPEELDLAFAIVTPDGQGFPVTAAEKDSYLLAFSRGLKFVEIRGHSFDRVYRVIPYDEWVMRENDERMERESRV